MDLISSLGVPSERLVAAVPAFAAYFKLADAERNAPGSPVTQGPTYITYGHVNTSLDVDCMKMKKISFHRRSALC